MGTERWATTTKAGHTIAIFFNRETGLLVGDLIHKNEKGGNEFLRVTLNEKRMLRHCEEGEPGTED